MIRRRFVTRRRDGSYRLNLDAEVVEVLGLLADQLDPALEDPSADPGLRRLFPPAHPDDLIAEAAWEIQRGDALRDARRAALARLRDSSDGPLDEEQVIGWMQGINALRLVLAERLDVEQDPVLEEAAIRRAQAAIEDEHASPQDRDAAYRLLGQWQVYELLGALVHDAVAALDRD